MLKAIENGSTVDPDYFKSGKEKTAIALFYFEDRSIKEISAILEMPQGTVKYQLSMGHGHSGYRHRFPVSR